MEAIWENIAASQHNRLSSEWILSSATCLHPKKTVSVTFPVDRFCRNLCAVGEFRRFLCLLGIKVMNSCFINRDHAVQKAFWVALPLVQHFLCDHSSRDFVHATFRDNRLHRAISAGQTHARLSLCDRVEYYSGLCLSFLYSQIFMLPQCSFYLF